jgi:hypothetical protein
VARLADDPVLRRSLGRAGRAKCISRYSDDAVRPALVKLLESAIARSTTLAS